MDTSPQNINQRINSLELEIKELKTMIKDLQQICSRMDNHITFVEKIYETIKAPLNYIKDKFDNLPSLTNS